MKESRELRFVDPVAEAYLRVLRQLPRPATIFLIGQSHLAHTVAGRATEEGLSLVTCSTLSPAVLKKAQILIFTETDGERLGTLLLECVDLEQVLIVAPVTDWHISRKPLFIVSIPKAGTHLAYELARELGYTAGVELPDFPRPQTWYCVEYSNSHTVARDFFVDSVRRSHFGGRHHPITRSPVLFVYRHPLDILVSEAHYYHREGKTVFAGYFAGEEFEQRVRRLVDDEWLLGSLRQRVGGFLPWLKFPNVIPVSFEELIGEAGGGSAKTQLRLIWSVQLKLQADGATERMAARLFNQNSATYREGRIGAYQSELPRKLVGELADKCADILSAFGYTARSPSLAPELTDQYISRPLRYSGADFSDMPLTVEHGFFGCNLVRYAHRFYAVPLSAGAVSLETLAPGQLNSLPSAPTLAELKGVLMIGRKMYDRQLAQLTNAGRVLRSDPDVQPTGSYWDECEAPHIFDVYKGHNLVLWRGRYIAVRQSVGAPDMPADLGELVSRRATNDVLVAGDIDTLMNDIDGLSTAVGLANVSNARICELQETLNETQRKIAQQQGKLELIEEHARALRQMLENCQDKQVALTEEIRRLPKTMAGRAAQFLQRLYRRHKDE